MLPVLNKHFTNLEVQKAQLLVNVKSWNLDQLSFIPKENHWSILEVLLHIVKVDTGVTKYLRKYQSSISEQKLGIGAWWRSLVLRSFLITPVMIKAPNVPGIRPSGDLDLSTINHDWDKSRIILSDYLNLFPEHLLDRYVFKHPLSGKFNIEQTLIFIYYHTLHHQHQLNRITSHSEFPKQV